VFIERNLIRINRRTIPVNGLPSAFDGFTIAHLTDLNLGTLVSTDFIRGVVERTSWLQTDMIVCTGDYWEDQLIIDQAFAGSEENDCRLLLSHNPDSVNTEFKTPLSVVLCGHTHGGQVELPFVGPPVLPVKKGLFQQADQNVPYAAVHQPGYWLSHLSGAL
jgi:predicted MPP superfamily phosphohydrolase